MLTLEEIKKLPARERIQKLREFEEEQKRLKAEEEKKRKNEEEEIIKKSIEELTEEEDKAEEEEKLIKEEKEKKQKQESLEEIAETAQQTEQKPGVNKNYALINKYGARLSHMPPTELSNELFELRESFEERNYLTPSQQQKRDALGEAIYQQNKRGYFKDDESRRVLNKMEEAFEEMRNPLKKVYK